jgi:hypothetical protein
VYQVRAWREAPWWVLDVDGVGVTQVRWLGEAEWMARDLIACALDLDAADIAVTVERGIGPVPHPGSRDPRVWLWATLDGVRDRARRLSQLVN